MELEKLKRKIFWDLRYGMSGSAPPIKYKSPFATEIDLWKSGTLILRLSCICWN